MAGARRPAASPGRAGRISRLCSGLSIPRAYDTGGGSTRNRVVALALAAMKVLALYDIHGNIDALEAVLADDRAADPDLVLVGGDAVPGPFPAQTLARLDRLEVPVRWVRG